MQCVPNYSHVLYIDISNELSNADKNKVISIIYDIIHNKIIVKKVSNMDIPIKWIVTNESDLLTYYTNVNGMLGDTAVHEHTKKLLSDIRKISNTDKFDFIVKKPLTEKLCLL